MARLLGDGAVGIEFGGSTGRLMLADGYGQPQHAVGQLPPGGLLMIKLVDGLPALDISTVSGIGHLHHSLKSLISYQMRQGVL